MDLHEWRNEKSFRDLNGKSRELIKWCGENDEEQVIMVVANFDGCWR